MFEIFCEGLVIGHSEFEARGTPPAIVRGVFRPTADYQSVAQLFLADAVARARPEDGADGEALLRGYYAARDRLEFAVIATDGVPLPVEYVHVYEPVRPSTEPQVVARIAVPAPRRP